MENSGYKIYRYSQNIMANGEKIRGIVWPGTKRKSLLFISQVVCWSNSTSCISN